MVASVRTCYRIGKSSLEATVAYLDSPAEEHHKMVVQTLCARSGTSPDRGEMREGRKNVGATHDYDLPLYARPCSTAQTCLRLVIPYPFFLALLEP